MSLAGRFVGVIWKHFEGILGVSEQAARQKLAVEISIEAEKVACRLLGDSQAGGGVRAGAWIPRVVADQLASERVRPACGCWKVAQTRNWHERQDLALPG